ncbi:MAG: helix-turn-helix transcriptional regulator [Methylotenera sp.]
MSTLDVTFLSRLKDERLRLKLTQQQAADICDISREVWVRYENGKNIPGGEVLQKFTLAGADIAYICSGSRLPFGTKEPSSLYARGDVDVLLDAYAHTDDVGRAALMAVVALIKQSK